MAAKWSKAALGRALNPAISGTMVAKLARRGMPTHSVAAAEEWRRMNLDQALTKAVRCPETAPRSLAVRSRSHEAPASPDDTAYRLLLTGKPRLLGGLLADLQFHGLNHDRRAVAVAFGSLTASLARVLEDAGEPESQLWDLCGEISEAAWREAERHADELRSEWADDDAATVHLPGADA